MTTQSHLYDQSDALHTAITEQDWIEADLARIERLRQDPFGRARAAQAHARDVDQLKAHARNWGEHD